MANVNVVHLIGNVTRDIELKYLPSGSPVAEMGIAVNRKWKSADGEQKEEVTFVDCVTFGKGAELLSKYVKKGDPIYLQGRLKLDQWEAQDGSKRSKLRVVIENFQFLAKGGNGGGDEQQQQSRRQPRQPQPAASDYDQGANDDAAPQGDDIPF